MQTYFNLEIVNVRISVVDVIFTGKIKKLNKEEIQNYRPLNIGEGIEIMCSAQPLTWKCTDVTASSFYRT